MLEEENAYFKNVVKDAISELKNRGSTVVFFQEQVDAIEQIFDIELNVEFDGTFYKLSIKEEEKWKLEVMRL